MASHSHHWSGAVLFAALLGAGPVLAKSKAEIIEEYVMLARTLDLRPTVSLTAENDFFAGTDRNYTTGTRLSFTTPPILKREVENFSSGVAQRVLTQGPDDVVIYDFAIGQNIYTPEDRLATAPLPNQHPYAGYLYGEFNVSVARPRQRLIDTLSLQLGLVGPAAGGEWVQDNFHKLIDDEELRGWDNQLKNEPGFALTYFRKYRREIVGAGVNPGGFGVDILPNAGLTVGNIRTQASVGATLRAGWGLDLTYGPPRVRPALGGLAVYNSPNKLSGFVFVGMEGRAVARNIFLDGNTWANSLSVNKRHFVYDIQAGFGIQYDDWAINYTLVSRGEEFRGQNGRQNFGSISVVRRF